MKKANWITIGAALVLSVACEKNSSLDVSLTEYQSKSDAALTKLTDSYSAALSAVPKSRRAVTIPCNVGDPNSNAACSSIPQVSNGSPIPCGGGLQSPFGPLLCGGGLNIPPAGINETVDVVATQCVSVLQSIPTTQASYAPAMATLARCLNRIISEQNLMLTWQYQLGNSNSQNRWAYALDYPNPTPFSSFSGQSFQQMNPFLSSGFTGLPH